MKTPSRSPRLFALLRASWEFALRHAVLSTVILWFFVVPYTLMDALDRMMDPEDFLSRAPLRAFLLTVDPRGVLVPIIDLVLLFFILWGTACVLSLTHRLIGNKSGRSRTSFATVRKQSFRLVVPLALTYLLRACITFYWSLLFFIPVSLALLWEPARIAIALIVDIVRGETIAPHSWQMLVPGLWLILLLPLLIPALLYAIRTSLFHVAIAVEDRSLRTALHRSTGVIGRRWWLTLRMLIGLALALFIPAGLLGAFFDAGFTAFDPRFMVISDLLGNTVASVALLLFLLATVELYGKLRDLPVEVRK